MFVYTILQTVLYLQFFVISAELLEELFVPGIRIFKCTWILYPLTLMQHHNIFCHTITALSYVATPIFEVLPLYMGWNKV